MIYLSLDTNVWLSLIGKSYADGEYNALDELLFWIENDHLKYILPKNIQDEWNRHKDGKLENVKQDLKKLQDTLLHRLAGTNVYDTLSDSGKIETFVKTRIERIDIIFRTKAEIARISPNVIKDAAKRNLNCLAPNHSKDSFRDTINILSLIEHLRIKGYENGFFVTINYADFSIDKANRYIVHKQLESDFKGAKLNYVYYDDSVKSNKLFNHYLRPHLPSYSDYLNQSKQKIQEIKLQEEKDKMESVIPLQNLDSEFLENINYIDAITAKREPNDVDKQVLTMLFKRHEDYRKYFLKKVGNNGMV